MPCAASAITALICVGIVVAECDEQRLRARDRPEEGEDEVGEDVAVAVERRDDERVAGGRDQERERRVDELRLVGHRWMALGGGVHLLLEHPLVDRADRVLRPPEDLGPSPLGELEGELGDSAADPALDPLCPEGRFVHPFSLPPLLRAVGVADGHADDRDRRVHAAVRNDPRDSPARADDHATADLLAENPVRRADVVGPFRRDRRRLQPEPVLADRGRRLMHHLVLRRPARFEREVVPVEGEVEADDLRIEHAQRFVEQLLPGLVAFEDGDRRLGH